MDPLNASLVVVTGIALALLGGRERSHQPAGSESTIGERAEAAVDSVTNTAIGTAETVGRFGTDVIASTLEVAGVAGAAIVRAVERINNRVALPGLNLAAGTVARAGGLVLDGAAAVADGVSTSLRRRSTSRN